MSLVPYTYEGKILFYRSKNTPWTTSATQIGTTSAAVASLAAKVAAAQAKLDAQVAAKAAAETATGELKAAIRDMGDAGADIIKQIRAKAAVDGNNVYFLAEIPVPATPTPVGPPGTPTNFKTTLNNDGTLTLSWKCPNPPGAVGTTYQVARRVGAGDCVPIGVSGKRSFTDNTVPAGAASLTYRIVAVRSTAIGQPGEFNVNFGVSTSGAATAMVQPAARLAA